MIVDFLRAADLADGAGTHDADEIAHRQRLFLVVGDEHEGDAEFALQRLQLDLHGRAQLLVKGCQRLVEKQHRRPVDDGARQRHALLLAARHFVDAPCPEAAQPDHFQRLAGAAGNLGGRDSRPHLLQAVGNVLLDVEVGEQRILLEHHVDGPPIGRNTVHHGPVDQHVAAGRLFEAADHAQARRLAAAGGAKQRHERALGNIEVDVRHRRHGAVGLAHRPELDVMRRSGCHAHSPWWS